MTRKRGSSTDPSTISGEGQKPSEFGGEGEGASTFGETPLRTAYPEGWRVGSEFQGHGSIVTSLPRINAERETDGMEAGYGCVVDPQDPKKLVRVGGDFADDVNNSPLVLTYDTFSNSWSDGPYPDLDEDIEDIGTVSYSQMGFGAVGDYIVLAGGILDSDFVDRIFILDTSADAPTWEESTQTLPVAVGSIPGTAVYQEELYVIGGSDSEFEAQSQVVKYDPAEDNLTQLDDLNGGSLALTNSTSCPVIDGEAYLSGVTEGDFDGEELSGDGIEFFKYDLETEEVTRLADLDVLAYEGSEPGDSGAGEGSLVEYEGNLIYMDGFYFYDGVDVGYYSVTDDEWVGEEWQSFDADDYDGDIPFQGAKKGVEIGGVIYIPGVGNRADSFVAHIPQKDPFGE